MEILVVLVIIGLISAVAVPQIMKLMESAKHKAAKLQLETVGQSLIHFSIDMGRYPSEREGLQILLNGPEDDPSWDGPYVRGPEQLKDPWGRPLTYQAPGTNGAKRFALRTLGADNAPGGSGDDRDIDYAD
jgi:general secretion pathway protein G